MNPNKKILALFQPYKFSRTFYSLELWKDIFQEVDGCILTNTFIAFEDPTLYNVNEYSAFNKIEHDNKIFVPINELQEHFINNLEKYNIFIMMGGATKKLIYPLLEELITNEIN